MAKILIVGAGDVGGRLAIGLAAAGHEVYALRRSIVELPGVHSLIADVTKPATLNNLPLALDALVTALSPGQGGVEAYQRVYVEGTRNVLRALSGQMLLRHIWLSSTGVYGEDDGQWLDEQTVARPRTATGQVLLAAEAVARGEPVADIAADKDVRADTNAQWPCTVVRLSGLYGPGRYRLLNWVESGRAVQSEPPSWSNRIHVEDAAAFVQHLLEKAFAGGTLEPLYLGVDDAPSAQHEVLTWLAAQMQLPVPALAVGAASSAGQGKRIANKALTASGYVLRYPDYRAGYAQVLAARAN